MKVKKSIQVTLDSNEVKAINTTAQILREICNGFNNCEGCPFMRMCDPSVSYPYIFLEDFVKSCEISIDK